MSGGWWNIIHDHRHQCNDHDNHDVHESENHHERNISKLALIEFKHHYEWIPCEPPRTWYLNHHNHWDLMMIASSLLQASYTAKAIAMIAESGAKAVSLKMEVIVVKFRHQYCESFWLDDFHNTGVKKLWGFCEFQNGGQGLCWQYRLRWLVQVELLIKEKN